MAKSSVLKSKSQLNKKTYLIFVALFALVGGVSLYVSHAAPHKNSPTTTIYGYKDVSSFYINGAPVTPAADRLDENGGVINSQIQVANMNSGDSLNWGGSGAVIAGSPTDLSDNYCYTLRSATPNTAAIQIGSTPITVKASPVSGSDTNYWSYICNSSSSLKVLSGSIHLYRVDLLETLAY
jgi:hypothetical protein